MVLLGIIAPIALGGAMELAQALLTENRSGDWMDLIADAVGVMAGAAVGCLALRHFILPKE